MDGSWIMVYSTFKNGNKWSGLWYDGESLENKCKSFGFNPGTSYNDNVRR